MKTIEIENIWDFHIDLKNIQQVPLGKEYLLEQIDVPTATHIGGFFNAIRHKPVDPPPRADEPQDKQLADIEDQIRTILSTDGLSLVLSAADIEGTGRQVLHAEGIYFIRQTKDIDLVDWLWDKGFRSLAPLYSSDNALGGGSAGDPNRGLTSLGRDFALRAWQKGFLIDCAHTNHKTKEDLVDLALKTDNSMNYSHGFLGAPIYTRYGERGLPRKTAQKLFKTSGLVGLSPYAAFLGTFERYLEEIDFLAEIAPNQLALGSDFAGIHFPGPNGNRQFEECKGVWGVLDLADCLANIHGKDFARAFCGGTLKAYLQRSLP